MAPLQHRFLALLAQRRTEWLSDVEHYSHYDFVCFIKDMCGVLASQKTPKKLQCQSSDIKERNILSVFNEGGCFTDQRDICSIVLFFNNVVVIVFTFWLFFRPLFLSQQNKKVEFKTVWDHVIETENQLAFQAQNLKGCITKNISQASTSLCSYSKIY